MSERDTAEAKNPFYEDITSAYDLSSGGMGVHLHSVRLLAAGQPLTDWERGSLGQYSCNYLVDPYVGGWRHPNPMWGRRPKFQSPHTKSHLRLLAETDAEYERLQWQIMRLLLGGEEGVVVKHPDKPISGKELPNYLRTAVERGLVVADDKVLSAMKPGSYPGEILRNLFKAGGDVSDDYATLITDLTYSDRFRSELLTATTHKLGAMLAVTDQITYDASSQGFPIPYSFKPERFDDGWRKAFGKPVPSIGELYQEAHSVFTSVANPRDGLVKHIFRLDRLPQLV